MADNKAGSPKHSPDPSAGSGAAARPTPHPRPGLHDGHSPELPGQISFFEAHVVEAHVRIGADAVGESTRSKAAEKPKSYPHAGHRQRVRERLSAGGSDSMPDYELLELLLTLALPRRDTKALAKQMITTFGSFAAALNAPRERLMEIDGVGEAVVSQFRILQAVAQRLARSQVMNKKPLSSWADVLDYLRIAQGHELKEQFRILFFDKKNVLIADEVQGKGTVDHTPVYVREVVKRALELSASAIILVHNHPSGDATPSRADIDMTRMIVEAARMVGVTVHDHIIVGRNGHASLKALKHM